MYKVLCVKARGSHLLGSSCHQQAGLMIQEYAILAKAPEVVVAALDCENEGSDIRVSTLLPEALLMVYYYVYRSYIPCTCYRSYIHVLRIIFFKIARKPRHIRQQEDLKPRQNQKRVVGFAA